MHPLPGEPGNEASVKPGLAQFDANGAHVAWQSIVGDASSVAHALLLDGCPVISSFRRRLALSLLLGTETVSLAFVIVSLLVPWDVTFSAFDGRPISTLEAYVNAAPYLMVLVATTGTVASLWIFGGRAGRTCVIASSAAHAVGAVWFIVGLGVADAGVVMVFGYAVALLGLAWPTSTALTSLRSSAR